MTTSAATHRRSRWSPGPRVLREPRDLSVLSSSAPARRSGQRTHIGDVVLGYRCGEYRGALFVAGAAAPERFDSRL